MTLEEKYIHWFERAIDVPGEANTHAAFLAGAAAMAELQSATSRRTQLTIAFCRNLIPTFDQAEGPDLTLHARGLLNCVVQVVDEIERLLDGSTS